MILTDDNFGTLVHAVEIGRRVYDKVVSYVRYQMTQLLALVLLFIVATVFDINDGVALTPSMVLYLLVFATAVGRRRDRGRSGRPRRDAPASAGPAAADRQPGRVTMWVGLRRRSLRGCVRTADRGARRAEHRPRRPRR